MSEDDPGWIQDSGQIGEIAVAARRRILPCRVEIRTSYQVPGRGLSDDNGNF